MATRAKIPIKIKWVPKVGELVLFSHGGKIYTGELIYQNGPDAFGVRAEKFDTVVHRSQITKMPHPTAVDWRIK